MSKRSIFLLLSAFCCLSLSAQIEYNPYAGLITGKENLRFVGPDGAESVYESSDWIIGADLLFGSGQLAPLAGLFYRSGSYSGPAGDGLGYERLHLPLGFAYRLVAPDFDFNLVPSLALAPGLVLADDTNLSDDPDIDWSARAGAVLYLDFVTVGVDYLRSFTNHFPEAAGERQGRWLVTLGVRW